MSDTLGAGAREARPPGEPTATGADWDARWRQFQQAFAQDPAFVENHDPVYLLPEEVVEALAGGRRPVLSQKEESVETAFRATCQGFGADTVGVWLGRRVQYPLFTTPSPPQLASGQISALGWDGPPAAHRVRLTLSELATEADVERLQRLGYSGNRLLDAGYRAGLAELRTGWEAVGRPGVFPLDASVTERLTGPGGVVSELIPNDPVRAWLARAGHFLRTHQLRRLETWDLPVAQGRLFGLPLGLVASTLGSDAPVDAVPAFDNLTNDSRLRERRREQQELHARHLGLGRYYTGQNTSPRDGHFSTPAAVFVLWSIERTATARYPGRRGMVAALTGAFRRIIGGAKPVTLDRIKQLRREYLDLLPGSPGWGNGGAK